MSVTEALVALEEYIMMPQINESETSMPTITTLFFDLGGVCLSNGWDHEQRQTVAQKLGFDYEPFDSRHRQVVDAMERGQLTLEDYLKWTLFYKPRPFTIEDVIREIQQLSTPFSETLELV